MLHYIHTVHNHWNYSGSSDSSRFGKARQREESPCPQLSAGAQAHRGLQNAVRRNLSAELILKSILTVQASNGGCAADRSLFLFAFYPATLFITLTTPSMDFFLQHYQLLMLLLYIASMPYRYLAVLGFPHISFPYSGIYNPESVSLHVLLNFNQQVDLTISVQGVGK